ncbi:MAG: MotA/TolQ/ExbB proton channel family protein [Alphaproteobacteria bacterium]|nr:MotA/TolQ/ExbB proton channel family protein [Alphaproteobacteria bacterium]
MGSFSLWRLFTTDAVTAVASIVLVIFSVVSWAVIVEKIRLFRAARRTKITGNPDDAIRPFDKNLWFLSMVAYVSPFIGLFGTVWGVMDSFASIGANQSVSIGVIAPGLAIALGTTALGLIVAIPAAIAHQVFTKRADELYDKLEHSK